MAVRGEVYGESTEEEEETVVGVRWAGSLADSASEAAPPSPARDEPSGGEGRIL